METGCVRFRRKPRKGCARGYWMSAVSCRNKPFLGGIHSQKVVVSCQCPHPCRLCWAATLEMRGLELADAQSAERKYTIACFVPRVLVCEGIVGANLLQASAALSSKVHVPPLQPSNAIKEAILHDAVMITRESMRHTKLQSCRFSLLWGRDFCQEHASNTCFAQLRT